MSPRERPNPSKLGVLWRCRARSQTGSEVAGCSGRSQCSVCGDRFRSRRPKEIPFCKPGWASLRLPGNRFPSRALRPLPPSQRPVGPPTDNVRPLVAATLGAIVFGHVVGHPVHFGRPAFSQGFVELLAKLLESLLVRFAQSQRVLRPRGGGR